MSSRFAASIAMLLGAFGLVWPLVTNLPIGLIFTCMGGGLASIGFGCLFYDVDNEFVSTTKTWDETSRNFVVRSEPNAVANISFDAFENFHVYDYLEDADDDENPSLQKIKLFGIKAYKKDGGRLIVDNDFDTIEEAEEEIARLKELTGIGNPASLKATELKSKSSIDQFEEKEAESVYSPAVVMVETDTLSQWSWTLSPKLTIFFGIISIGLGFPILIFGIVFFEEESPGYLLLLFLEILLIGVGGRYLFNNYGRGFKLTAKDFSITVESLWNFKTQKTESLDMRKIKTVVYQGQNLYFYDSHSKDRKALLCLSLKGLTTSDGYNLENQLGAIIAKKTGQNVDKI